MAKKTFQIDGIGINKEHYEGWSEADFIKDISETLPDKFGDEKAKAKWGKTAYAAMNEKPKEEVKETKKSGKA